VTALYEIALQNSCGTLIDPLRYQRPADSKVEPATAELGFLKLRYKSPEGSSSRLLTQPLLATDIRPTLAATSDNYRFSAAVAAFGALLRGGEYLNGYDFEQAHALASAARDSDPAGYRGELLGLIRTAQALTTPDSTANLELSQRQ
jgi:Ca-activated chloride channel family protein